MKKDSTLVRDIGRACENLNDVLAEAEARGIKVQLSINENDGAPLVGVIIPGPDILNTTIKGAA